MIQARFSFLRNKFFLLLGTIIFLTFIIFKFDQSNGNDQATKQTLLYKIKKLELQNEEQQQRLFAERELYERTKKELNASIRDLKEVGLKENQDASLRFSSLQQQYKILKTQNDDLQQHCENSRNDMSKENDELKNHLDKVQALLKNTQSLKESFQVKYENLLSEKEKLEKLIVNKPVTGDEHHLSAPDPPKIVDKTFREQVPIVRNDEQMSRNVLQQPSLVLININSSTTTTPTSVVKKEHLVATAIKASAKVKQLPRGVLPIPDLKVSSDLKYFNGKSPKAAGPRPSLDNTLGKPQSEIDETENRANNAAEEFNIEEKINNLDDGILQEGDKIINNAAEELDVHNKGLRHGEMDMEVINRPGNGVNHKLNDEIAGDHGKEAGYPEDLHMVEGQQEENDDLGDVGDYDHDDPRRKLGGVAERN